LLILFRFLDQFPLIEFSSGSVENMNLFSYSAPRLSDVST